MINDPENPGKILQGLLKEIYPLDNTGSKSFVHSIDNALMAEGEFFQLVYESSINHLVRRLITSAEHLRRKYDLYPDDSVSEIRKFLRDFTHIPPSQREKIVTLLVECLRERDRKISLKLKDSIRKEAQSRGANCYLCGCEIDFERTDAPRFNSLTLDHLWPRKMGGKSLESNLKIACKRCNELKGDYIDASDFHYEEICLVTNEKDESFNVEFRREYKIAVLAKSDFKCMICGKPAERVGELQFARREPSDSWHFLNVDAYCSEHTPE